MKNFLVLLALLTLAYHNSVGQVLALKNKKHHKSLIFKTGDELCYKLNQYDPIWRNGSIESFDSLYMIVSGRLVPLSDITAIEIERKNFHFAQNGGMLMLAGLVLPTVSLLNDFINWDKSRFTQTQVIVSGALMISGIGIGSLGTKICVIGRKYTLEILIF